MDQSPAKTHLPLFSLCALTFFSQHCSRTHSHASKMTNTSITRTHSKLQIALITPPTHSHLMLYSETSAQSHTLMHEIRAAHYCSLIASKKSLHLNHCRESTVSAHLHLCFPHVYTVSVFWILLPFCVLRDDFIWMQIAMETIKDYKMCVTENENRNQNESWSWHVVSRAEAGSFSLCTLPLGWIVVLCILFEVYKVSLSIYLSLSPASLRFYSLVWAEQMWLSVSR